MKINVLGSGHMGKQICSLFVVLGHEVNIWRNSKENLDILLKNEISKLEKHFDINSRGKYIITTEISKLQENFTVETVKEDLEIKKKVISKLNYNTNIFSNTSSLSLSEIGPNINALHFMNPITVPIIELCKKNNYSENQLKELITSLENISYNIIEVSDKSGFLVNRILFKNISYFFYLYEVEKISIKNLKQIYKNLYNNSDPIKLVNMIGLDTTLSILKNLNKVDKSFYISSIIEESVKNNIYGFKNKKLLKL